MKSKAYKAVALIASGCAALMILSACGEAIKKDKNAGDPASSASFTATDESGGSTNETTAQKPETTVPVTTEEKTAEVFWGHSEPRQDSDARITTGVPIFYDPDVAYGKRINERVIFFKDTNLEGCEKGEFPLYEKYTEVDDDALFALNVICVVESYANNKPNRMIRESDIAVYNLFREKIESTEANCFSKLRTGRTTDPEGYEKAAGEYEKCMLEYYQAKLKSRGEVKKDELEYLYSHCHSVVCTSSDENEASVIYLLNTNSVAVVIMSKAQIEALSGTDYRYDFKLADDTWVNRKAQFANWSDIVVNSCDTGSSI